MKGKKIKDDGQNSLKLAFSLKEDKVDEGLIRSCLLSQSFDRPQKTAIFRALFSFYGNICCHMFSCIHNYTWQGRVA